MSWCVCLSFELKRVLEQIDLLESSTFYIVKIQFLFMRRPNIMVFVGIALLFYAALLAYFNAGEIFRAAKNFDVFYIVPIIFLISMSYFFKFSRWAFFLRGAGVTTPNKNLFLIFVSSLSMLITPGKVGDVLKSYLLKKKFGYEQRRTLPAVVLERITDLPALAILSVAGAYSVYQNKLIVFLPFIVLFASLFAIKSNTFLRKILGFIGSHARTKKYSKSFEELYQNLRASASYKNLLTGTLLGIVAWTAEGLLFYALLIGLGLQVSPLLAISIYAISVIVGVLSFIPGGIGASEASMFGLLIVAGISKPEALAATIIFRAITLWLSLAIGSLVLSGINRTKGAGD